MESKEFKIGDLVELIGTGRIFQVVYIRVQGTLKGRLDVQETNSSNGRIHVGILKSKFKLYQSVKNKSNHPLTQIFI